MARYKKRNQQPKEFSEKVVEIKRVSKKTKGGNQMSFTALMVVGDKKGKVGVALGKAPDVLSAIKKGVRRAKKEFIRVPMQNGTIPFELNYKHGAAKIYLKPAPKGSGIIAGGAVRSVVEAAGITDIVGKILGSDSQTNNVYATFKALKKIRRMVKIKDIKLEAKKAAPKKTKTKTAPTKKQPSKTSAKKKKNAPKAKKTTKKPKSTKK